ncbi:SufD family Fe-S cluster assembly protein [Candidatus Aalborgicola defluviihabitans]|uniref:SufD family Fe-S cluster assembly protein n=1 Tax=Candidatus Aalborgicola defluviihabitans TaxID=3386187 RepID=UPI0039B89076
MLIGQKSGAHTFPYIQVRNDSATVEHEASTSRIGEDQLFYFAQRGIGAEEAISMIINGFCKDVFTIAAHGVCRRGHSITGLKQKRASDDFAQ